jgi:catechol 2,3-dioxygenase-like lactoylglutathione lyase family enzyme
MIYGAHVILNSRDPDADRDFLAGILGLASVDAGHGWLIFALPPAEAAIHPADAATTDLYLMCDDLAAETRALQSKGVRLAPVTEARWGSLTSFTLPGGSSVGLYQPTHASPISPPSN